MSQRSRTTSCVWNATCDRPRPGHLASARAVEDVVADQAVTVSGL